jgi:hypothetical protein
MMWVSGALLFHVSSISMTIRCFALRLLIRRRSMCTYGSIFIITPEAVRCVGISDTFSAWPAVRLLIAFRRLYIRNVSVLTPFLCMHRSYYPIDLIVSLTDKGYMHDPP